MGGVLGRTGRPCSVDASLAPSPHGVGAAQPRVRPEWRLRGRRSGVLVRREGPNLPTVVG